MKTKISYGKDFEEFIEEIYKDNKIQKVSLTIEKFNKSVFQLNITKPDEKNNQK